MQIKFLAYSDIHHDRRAARCIELADTIEIEQQVHHRVIEGGFDFSIFCGDRFLRREPEDEVKVKADRALLQMLQNRQIPHYHLVGNHDWTKNNREWHTSESIKYLGQNMTVLDQCGSYETRKYLIHALPADMPFDIKDYKPDPTKFNLFVFHGIVKGSLMADSSERVFEDGIQISQIDQSAWNFVLGGDIHVPQTIPFRNTKGGYLGSVLQRTRADADKQRGWLEVTAIQDLNGQGGWDIQADFVPTRNFFHRELWEVGPDTTFEDLKIDTDYVSNQAVEIKLVGDKADVDRIADDKRWSNFQEFEGAKTVEVVRDYKAEQSDSVIDLSTSSSVFDDLTLYLDSGFANIGNLSRDKIFEIVQSVREV